LSRPTGQHLVALRATGVKSNTIKKSGNNYFRKQVKMGNNNKMIDKSFIKIELLLNHLLVSIVLNLAVCQSRREAYFVGGNQ